MNNIKMKLDYDKAEAVSTLHGSTFAPKISGKVEFYNAPGGTVVRVDVCGLPPYKPAQNGEQPIGPFGFHIHAGSTCGMGDGKNAYESAMGHYNPDNQLHGNHAGDLPVLFSNNGCAHMIFYTDRFKPSDVVGHSLIIHQNPDDFRTQPSGNSGVRIACGVIEKV